MRLNKILTVCLIFFALVEISYAQKSSSAVLVDEFESLPCGEYEARMDRFLVEIYKAPLSKGFVVIYGKDKELLDNLGYERWSNGTIRVRRFDKSRIEVVRGALGERRKIQFWKVLPGQVVPGFRKEDWTYDLPASTKPFIFTSYNWNDNTCPSSPSPLKNYADLLSANRAARGNLVIRAGTKKQMRKTEKELLDELVGDYKVPRSRLKVFYVQDKKYGLLETDVEFWFVP